MIHKYSKKYRSDSIRLQNWNYGWDAAYFITICTQNRENYFGNIVDSFMELSLAGILANLFWFEIKNHAKNIELGPFVIMPDHIHGILILETRHALSQQSQRSQQPLQQTIGQQRFQNQGKNTISSIIGSYKSAVTRQAHRMGIGFAWQALFYDHIIRDKKSYDRIKKYIIENPMKWEK